MKTPSLINMIEPRSLAASLLPITVSTWGIAHLFQANLSDNIALILLFTATVFLLQAIANVWNIMTEFPFNHHDKIMRYVSLGLLSLAALIAGFSFLWLANHQLAEFILGAFSVGIVYCYSASWPLPIKSLPAGEFVSSFFMGLIAPLMLIIALPDKSVSLSTNNLLNFLVLSLLAAAIPIFNIMFANNISDFDEDVAKNRLTLPFYLGKHTAVVVYDALYLLSLVGVGYYIYQYDLRLRSLLFIGYLLIAFVNIKQFSRLQSKQLTFKWSVITAWVLSLCFLITSF